MSLPHVNYVGVVAATVAAMVLGFVWYHPKVFGTAWMKLIGKKMEDLKAGAQTAYLFMAILAIVEAWVLAMLLTLTNALRFRDAWMLGFWIWLGFVATSFGSLIIFEGRPRNLYLINVGYHLVSILLMGTVLVYLNR